MRKIAIVILTYNGRNYLPDLFKSLKENYLKDSVDIIVVDNASLDGTKALVKFEIQKRELKISLVENKKNFGFAKGNNIGIKKALERQSDYIILLNQDTVVEKNWLEEIIRVAEIEEKAGIIQSMIMLWPEKDKIQTSGNKIHFLGFGFSGNYRLNYRLIAESIQSTTDIAYASGAAMLIKREVLEKIGLLDEDLWAYHEDLDLSWRARLAGYEIKCASKSIVFHKYSFEKTKEKYYLMERNRLIVLLKNYKILTLILILPAFLIMEIGLLFFALTNGWLREKFQSYQSFFKNFFKTLIKRKRIQKQRIVKDKDIIKFFTGQIKFENLRSPLLNYLANPFFNLYWWMIKKLIIW
jgi:hypothetical protein